MQKSNRNKHEQLDKVIDFGRQIFAATLRSRKGSLTELSTLLRFQKGTKGFERQYSKLLPLISELKKAFFIAINTNLPTEGFRLGIFDDTLIKKSGKKFPEERIQHDHTTKSHCTGMRVLSSLVYQNGKSAAVSSCLVTEESKLDLAKKEIDKLIADFIVDIFLFDSWYCKEPVLTHINGKGKLFVSRLRCDSKALLGEEEQRLDALVKSIPHKSYEHIAIKGKSYWIKELEFDLKAYGTMHIIASKEGAYDEPIFLATNAKQFSASFIVKLYLKRFSIEIFFKDAKQFLNFETFTCRTKEKWEIHLHLANVLHWAIQKINSISKTIWEIREDIDKCFLFINENPLLMKFFEELKKLCLT